MVKSDYQQELELRIAVQRQCALENIDGAERTINALVSGLIEPDEYTVEVSLHVTLLIVHTSRGKELFLRILEFAKTLYPDMAKDYWDAFDNLENIEQTDFFGIPGRNRC